MRLNKPRTEPVERNKYTSMKRLFIAYISTALLLFSAGSELRGQAFIDIESGVVLPGYNNVRIPGNTGTLLSLSEDFKASSEIFIRLRAGYTIGRRHTLSLLYAPLKIESEGIAGKDIVFQTITIPQGSLTEGSYRFNSYRLTYRYDFVKGERVEFGAGFTAKIRDAEITLRSGSQSDSKPNVGFVPIINFRLNVKATDALSVLLEGDALAAPQGRAEDVLLAVSWKVSENMGLRAGYRILEGGADNDEVYNFALFNYISAGLNYSF
jgi:hypothetical protein